MANGTEQTNGDAAIRLLNLPLWARLLLLVGPLSAIAVYLVWVGAQTLPRLEQDLLLQRAAIEKSQRLLEEGNRQLKENYLTIMQICVNTSKTEIAAAHCFDRRRTDD